MTAVLGEAGLFNTRYLVQVKSAIPYDIVTPSDFDRLLWGCRLLWGYRLIRGTPTAVLLVESGPP